jgi:hypothetical protein
MDQLGDSVMGPHRWARARWEMRYDSRPRTVQPLPAAPALVATYPQLVARATLEALVMIARIRRFALAALALIPLTAPFAGAQIAATPASAVQHQAAPAGPTVDRAAVGARSSAQQPSNLADAAAEMQSRLGLGQARALMIVGFAAVIIGLLVEGEVGTLIAIAGAAVGLYGLYHYLK